MYLQHITIKHWQSIEKIKLNIGKLELFIGQSNTGKSAILSAIMYFLHYRELRENDWKKGANHIEIKGTFSIKHPTTIDGQEIHGNITLKLDKYQNNDERYYYKFGKDWRPITREIYDNLMKRLGIIYIPANCGATESKKFISEVLQKMKIKDIDKELTRIATLINTPDLTSHGYYRNIIFELIREFGRVARETRKEIVHNTLLIYEEPELYLHPQREKELYYNLQTLSHYGFEIFLTTHSSNFVSLEDYKSINIVRKNTHHNTEIFNYQGELFNGDELQTFNMNYWINPDRGELFFAKKVILVEGQTDKIILSALAKRLGVYKFDYFIVECGSKSIIPFYIALLNAFKLPYVVVYDKDNHSWRNEIDLESSKHKNKHIQHMIDKNLGKFIECDNDIEEELYGKSKGQPNYKNKPFSALMAISKKDFNIPKKFSKKILEIYK